MGNFYTNITLQTSDRQLILDHMRAQARSCFVSRLSHGFVTVYDRVCDEQDVGDLEKLTLDLSARFQCTACAVLNHDDDVLWLALTRNGNLRTVYRTDQFMTGSAWRFAAEFKVLGLLPLIWLLMRWPVVLFQIWRHALLVWALGMPNCSVGFGYDYLSRGERPSGDHLGEFDSV